MQKVRGYGLKYANNAFKSHIRVFSKRIKLRSSLKYANYVFFNSRTLNHFCVLFKMIKRGYVLKYVNYVRQLASQQLRMNYG